MSQTTRTLLPSLLLLAAWTPVAAQPPAQPRVTPGPSEPDWVAILDARYGLRVFADLANPVTTTPDAVPGLFQKAGDGPVIFRPLIALGLETTTRGGWYRPESRPERRPLWSYTFKNTGQDLERDQNLPPPLAAGSEVAFDPGEGPFGLWVGNDQFDDGGVYTEPAAVRRLNARLAAQPYKAMIYPLRDRQSGRVLPDRYLIGWEYSTNDDFQDVVCEVVNARLVVPTPP